MSSASVAYSFPAPLGRRGTAAVVVIGVHLLLGAALVTGLAVHIPGIVIPVGPPVVAPRPPEPVITHEVPTSATGWTFGPAEPTPITIVPVTPPLPDVAPAAIVPDVAPGAPAASAVRVLHSQEPEYPTAARRLGEQGTVVVRVLVGADGRPDRVEVASSSGSPRLDGAALSAVRQWLFVPAASGAGPVASWTTLRVVFRLTN